MNKDQICETLEHIKACAQLWSESGVSRVQAITREADKTLAALSALAAEPEVERVRERVEEAMKRRDCKHTEHGQRICVGCAALAVSFELMRPSDPLLITPEPAAPSMKDPSQRPATDCGGCGAKARGPEHFVAGQCRALLPAPTESDKVVLQSLVRAGEDAARRLASTAQTPEAAQAPTREELATEVLKFRDAADAALAAKDAELAKVREEKANAEEALWDARTERNAFEKERDFYKACCGFLPLSVREGTTTPEQWVKMGDDFKRRLQEEIAEVVAERDTARAQLSDEAAKHQKSVKNAERVAADYDRVDAILDALHEIVLGPEWRATEGFNIVDLVRALKDDLDHRLDSSADLRDAEKRISESVRMLDPDRQEKIIQTLTGVKPK